MSDAHNNDVEIKPEDIVMPDPSFWPILLAFGFTLIIGGLAVNIPMAAAGLVIALTAGIGWIIEPPHQEH